MLGEKLLDPFELDGNAAGLGFLPLVTQFERDKLLRPAALRFASRLAAPWAALSGVEARGYEIHHGRTTSHPGSAAPTAVLRSDSGEVIGWQKGSVLGCYAHGLFEQPAVLRALFDQTGSTLEQVFDGLADFIDAHFLPGTLMGLLER